MSHRPTSLAIFLFALFARFAGADPSAPVRWQDHSEANPPVELDEAGAACFRHGVDAEAQPIREALQLPEPRGTYSWGTRSFVDMGKFIIEFRAGGSWLWKLNPEQQALLDAALQRGQQPKPSPDPDDVTPRGPRPAPEPKGPRPPRSSGYAAGGLAQSLQRAGMRPLPQWIAWSGSAAAFVGQVEASRPDAEADGITLRVTRMLAPAPEGVILQAGDMVAFPVVKGTAGAVGVERVWLLGLSDATIVGFESYPAKIEAELARQIAARPAVLLDYYVSGGIMGRMDHLIVLADGSVIDGFGGEVSCVTNLRDGEKAALYGLVARLRPMRSARSDGERVPDGMSSGVVFAGKGESDGGSEVRDFAESLLKRLVRCRTIWRDENAPAGTTPEEQEEHRRTLAERASATFRE